MTASCPVVWSESAHCGRSALGAVLPHFYLHRHRQHPLHQRNHQAAHCRVVPTQLPSILSLPPLWTIIHVKLVGHASSVKVCQPGALAEFTKSSARSSMVAICFPLLLKTLSLGRGCLDLNSSQTHEHNTTRCIDNSSDAFDSLATYSDGSCPPVFTGCTDVAAKETC